MRVLVDIVHPAHVHFYRHMITEFETRGHEVMVVSRHKDITTELLDDFEIPHRSVSRVSSTGGAAGQAMELAVRDWRLWGLAREFRPDVILARNPSGMHAARLVGAHAVFDTDDGREAGLVYRLAAPFADVITSPAGLEQDLGPKQVSYDAYKSTAYLHPRRFKADPAIRQRLGLDPNEPFVLVRLVAMAAAHDRGESGLPPAAIEAFLGELGQLARVFVTSETHDSEHEALKPDIRPSEMLDLIAEASLFVGDSQTMAIEAALLGVPVVHVSSFSGRLGVLEGLRRQGHLRSYQPDEWRRALADATSELADPGADPGTPPLDDQVDLTGWYVDLVEALVDP